MQFAPPARFFFVKYQTMIYVRTFSILNRRKRLPEASKVLCKQSVVKIKSLFGYAGFFSFLMHAISADYSCIFFWGGNPGLKPSSIVFPVTMQQEGDCRDISVLFFFPARRLPLVFTCLEPAQVAPQPRAKEINYA